MNVSDILLNVLNDTLSSNSSTHLNDYDYPYPDDYENNSTTKKHYPLFVKTLIAIACAIVIILCLAGNALVVWVILRFKRLKNATNYILLSLAIADLTVSILVMIPAMIQDVLQRWIFNELFCKFYNAFDITCCTASILHLLLVALDRYLAIFKPLTYKNMVGKLNIFLSVVVIWIVSSCMSFIPIFLGWNQLPKPSELAPLTISDNLVLDELLNATTTTATTSSITTIFYLSTERQYYSINDTNNDLRLNESMVVNAKEAEVKKEECDLEANIVYAILSSSLSFYIPFIVMTIVYMKIYIVARRQANAIAKLDIHKKRLNNNNSNSHANMTNNELNEQEVSKIKEILKQTGDKPKINDKGDKKGRFLKLIKQLKTIEKKRTKDTKAIRTLGIIMGIFLLCWLPFFVMYCYMPITGHIFPYEIIRLITWIGYVNSFINPIIYALTNKDFSKAYGSTLRAICRRCCSQRIYESLYEKSRIKRKNTLTKRKRFLNCLSNLFAKLCCNCSSCCNCCGDTDTKKRKATINDQENVIETKKFLNQSEKASNEVLTPCKQSVQQSEKMHEENENQMHQVVDTETDLNNNSLVKLERPSELLLIKVEEPQLSEELRQEERHVSLHLDDTNTQTFDSNDVPEETSNRHLNIPKSTGKRKSNKSSESEENYHDESDEDDDFDNDTESDQRSPKVKKKQSRIKVKFEREANGEEDVFDFEKNKLRSPMKSSPGHQFIKRLSLTFTKPPRLNRKGSSLLDELIRSKRTPVTTPTSPTKGVLTIPAPLAQPELSNELAELNYYLEKENGYGDGLDDSYFIEECKTADTDDNHLIKTKKSHYKSDPDDDFDEHDDDDDDDDDLSTTTNTNTATSSSKKTSMQSEKMIEMSEMKTLKAQQASINKKFKKFFSVKRQT